MTGSESLDTTTTIATGSVRGARVDGGVEFRGVPFAGPIGGTRRFKAPTPAAPWTGTLDADTWPPMVPQSTDPLLEASTDIYRTVFGVDYTSRQSEDGLFLNVWTPDLDDRRRPVMVFLHGGGFAAGQATRPRENGARLAASEDVVIVAPSHRLGLLGYLRLTSLSTQYDSNVGMLDIIAALEWVRDNIAAFGGDPDNVTVFGESGGSLKIATLLAMPAAQGLFHKAICQSGAYPLGGMHGPVDVATADALTLKTLEKLSVPPDDVAALLAIPIPTLLQAAPTDFMTFGPVLDGVTLRTTPAEAVSAHDWPQLPVLIGTDLHELRVISQALPIAQSWSELATELGDGGEQLLRHYADHHHGMPFEALRELVLTDAWFRVPSIRFAERIAASGGEVYMYLFTWENQARPDIGATHGVETPFVFNNTDAIDVTSGAPGAQKLADAMSSAWASFARTGNPNGSGSLPDWPRYDSVRRSTMFLGAVPEVVDDPCADDRIAWDRARSGVDAAGRTV